MMNTDVEDEITSINNDLAEANALFTDTFALPTNYQELNPASQQAMNPERAIPNRVIREAPYRPPLTTRSEHNIKEAKAYNHDIKEAKLNDCNINKQILTNNLRTCNNSLVECARTCSQLQPQPQPYPQPSGNI